MVLLERGVMNAGVPHETMFGVPGDIRQITNDGLSERYIYFGKLRTNTD